MKLEAFQCPVCFSTHFRIEGDLYVCESCGNSYTKKQADSQMFIDLRIANSQRQFADFAKAKSMYDQILAKYPDEDLTAVYWGLLLCDQQVMLEMDNNGQLFPSFYNVNEKPIDESNAYKRFMTYLKKTSPEKLPDFMERLNIIENAREKAVLIKNTTKPYDVFICFKKTEISNPDIVTKDYDLACEIYNDISLKYKTFFSEKSLRGIKVREYEPNIYFGLYSAKIMLLICSKKEFVESHWMQNEWRRFLELKEQKKVGDKCIIPIFTDNFSPDDLPIELRNMQGLKYGISLLKDIEKELDSIITPRNVDAAQQREIDANRAQIQKLTTAFEKLKEGKIDITENKEKKASIDLLDESKRIEACTKVPQIQSLLKFAKVQIEDLGEFEEAFDTIHKIQLRDAENYMSWYYKLLIDFKAQTVTELVMHDNYKDSLSYKLLKKYAILANAESFVMDIDNKRTEYIQGLADKVNDLLKQLDDNPHPMDEDIYKIKNVFESLPREAKNAVVDLKPTILNAKAKIRKNKIDNFNSRLNLVSNKDYPNYDDLLNIEEEYNKLSDDEKDLAGDYKKVVVNASNKMKMTGVQKVQQKLTELDNMDLPSREDLIHVEKAYQELEDEYKKYVKDFTDILMRAYDRKYKADAKQLEEYFAMLPKKELNREMYVKLFNRFKALPKKYRVTIKNVENLDDYYERLEASEGKTVKKENKEENKKAEPKKEENKKKKPFWKLWERE